MSFLERATASIAAKLSKGEGAEAKGVRDAVLAGLGVRLEEFSLMPRWMPPPRSDEAFTALMADVPWHPKKWLGMTLPQLVYEYSPSVRDKSPIPSLETILTHVETSFATKLQFCWCNRFDDGSHNIDWHQDKYGAHLFVLSFGAARAVEWRVKSNKEPVPAITASHGDLYYFAPTWDKRHEHRVPATPDCTEPRISLAIFVDPPGSHPPSAEHK